MFPMFDNAYEIPIPVDLIEVGNDYVVIRPNNAKLNVFDILLNPINNI